MDFLTLKDLEDKDISTMSREELQALAVTYGLTDEPINVVKIDSLVILKIIKHCLDNPSEQATGTLLGLDIASTLQITNSFPLPLISSSSSSVSSDSSQSAATSSENYQTQMMLSLRDLSNDYSTVGWYTSSSLGHLPSTLLPNQLTYQTSLPKSVFILFDPLKFKLGTLSLRSFRLKSSYLAGESRNSPFEEIKTEIAGNLDFLKIWQNYWDASGWIAKMKVNWGGSLVLEKGVENLVESVEGLARDQWMFYQKKKRERKDEESEGGNRDDDGSNGGGAGRGQIEGYIGEVLEYAEGSWEKLWVAKGVTIGNQNTPSLSESFSSSNFSEQQVGK